MAFCFRWIQNPDGAMGLILERAYSALPGSSGATVYKDDSGGHDRKENGHTGNDAVEIQTPRSR
jgi:hypothetical protein